MSYLAKLKEKIGGANATSAPAKAAEVAFAASAASIVAIVAQNSVGVLPPELDRLINAVASFHAFSQEELQQAREIAAGDIDRALTCFRLLAMRADVWDGPQIDSRVTCATCANLMRGHCQAAANGLMTDTYSGYSPVPDVPRNCEHYIAKPVRKPN